MALAASKDWPAAKWPFWLARRRAKRRDDDSVDKLISHHPGRQHAAAGLADRPTESWPGRFPPRVRARELWRIPESLPQRRRRTTPPCCPFARRKRPESISSRTVKFAAKAIPTASPLLWKVSISTIPGSALDRSGHPNPVPRVVGTIRRKHAVCVDDLLFLRAHTDRAVKVTVPGPFTMAQQAQIDHYGGSRKLAAMDYAAAVNEEIRDLFAAGAERGADRRTLHAGAARRGAGIRARGAKSCARGRRRATRPSTSALATPRSFIRDPPGIPFCRNWRAAPAGRSP